MAQYKKERNRELKEERRKKRRCRERPEAKETRLEKLRLAAQKKGQAILAKMDSKFSSEVKKAVKVKKVKKKKRKRKLREVDPKLREFST